MQHPPCSPALRRPPHDPLRSEEQARRELYRHSAEKRRDCVQLLLDGVSRHYADATTDEERLELLYLICERLQRAIERRQRNGHLLNSCDTHAGCDATDRLHDYCEDMKSELKGYMDDLAEERAEASDDPA